MLRGVGHGREESVSRRPFSTDFSLARSFSTKIQTLAALYPTIYTVEVPDSCCFLACRIALRWRCDFQDGEEAP